MQKIASLQHPLVKHWVALRKERTVREEAKTLLITGKKVLLELLFPIQTLITLHPDAEVQAAEKILVSPEILKKITGLEESDGYAAVVTLPEPQELENKRSLLIVDQIADPGNLGTLVRTALGLGWEGICATPGTVDFFNDKALRASQGAIFRLPFSWQTPKAILSWIEQKGVDLFVADLGAAPLQEKRRSKPYALLLSNETKGVRPWGKKMGKKISIPMHNGVDSLNVAIAGAIFLYIMRPSF